jgi:hypothetical protein
VSDAEKLSTLLGSAKSKSWHNNPVATPYYVAAWWCGPHTAQKGVLLDPFSDSRTMLVAGLGHGASKVIGIEKEDKYLKTAKKRIEVGSPSS